MSSPRWWSWILALQWMACGQRDPRNHSEENHRQSSVQSVRTVAVLPVDRCAGVHTPEGMQVPSGFCVRLVSGGFRRARQVVVAPDGRLLVITSGHGRRGGSVVRLSKNAAGQWDTYVWWSGLERLHGAVLVDGFLYVAEPGRILRARYTDTAAAQGEVFSAGFPAGGLHTHRGLALGPDRALYYSLGSASNNCGREGNLREGEDPCPEAEPGLAQPWVRGAIYRIPIATGVPELFARGLRNNLGFAWHPSTRRMWGVDNGRDYVQRVAPTLSDEEFPHEELNEIFQGRDYGWPYCFDAGRAAPEYPSREAYCRGLAPPPTLLPAHAAPLSIIFVSMREFPARWHGAFVTYHGYRPSGRRVVRIPFGTNGAPSGPPEDFLVVNPRAGGPQGQFSGIATSPDGTLFVTDDTGGAVYEVLHDGRTDSNSSLQIAQIPLEPPEQIEARCRANAARNGPFAALERTVIDTTCVLCHAANAGNLTLRRCAIDENYRALTQGRSAVSGAYVVPGNLREGVLLQRLQGETLGLRMPPPGIPMPPGGVQLFERWIANGAQNDPR